MGLGISPTSPTPNGAAKARGINGADKTNRIAGRNGMQWMAVGPVTVATHSQKGSWTRIQEWQDTKITVTYAMSTRGDPITC